MLMPGTTTIEWKGMEGMEAVLRRATNPNFEAWGIMLMSEYLACRRTNGRNGSQNRRATKPNIDARTTPHKTNGMGPGSRQASYRRNEGIDAASRGVTNQL